MARSLLSRVFTDVTEALDRRFRWHRLPVPLSLLTLVGLRMRLRESNLYDTSSTPADQPLPEDSHHLTTRTPDGAFNDLENPKMGSVETRFGRNVPVELTYPENEWALLRPNPRTVSRELLTRHEFQPATTLNLLAAAWLQFMIRDWFSHGKSEKENPWELELEEDDPWTQERPMQIMRTRRDPTRSPNDTSPPTHLNTQSHWWDGSQIYGSDKETQARVRSGEDGKLIVGQGNTAPIEWISQASQEPGFWIGLALMQTIFMLEHNAICDRLRAEYPSWSDDVLFDHARLINAALLAKIHTVEWTTAILGHPTMQIGMRTNWWGVAGEKIHKLLGRISSSEVLSGIPGSQKDHFGVPYSITEEFVAVYRMHPLIPDDFDLRSATNDARIQERSFREVAGPHVPELLDEIRLADLFYSFGIANPGAISLHNYPRLLQEYERPDGILMDLAATDILRSRELGVPRYNAFRKLLHLPPVESFEELTDDPALADELRRVYDGEIDRVDLTIGLYAEPKPRGFGFSDTAFRIFILMASRRLNSDRFFTTDYTPRIYTQTGLDWVDDNDMSSVLLRHFHDLLPSLRNVDNAFAPWITMAKGTGWEEDYSNEEGKINSNGTPEKEERFFDKIREEIKEVVKHFEKDNGRPMRGNHAKILVGIKGAAFRVSPQIPPDLSVGFLQEPGKVYNAQVRFSNASSEYRTDDSKTDLRGVAMRVSTEQGDHDFLMTNAEPHHARDAREAMVTIMAGTKKDAVEDLLGEAIGKGAFYAYLLLHLGLKTARRIADTLKVQTEREVKSLATETYWSRAPIAIGKVPDPEQSVAVKYKLEPVIDRPDLPGDSHDLGQEFKTRISQGGITFLFQVQRYIAPGTTPIEDATVHWPSDFETVGELIIPQNANVNDDYIDGLVFSPWNVDTKNFQPLGSMNRSRKKVYEASASLR